MVAGSSPRVPVPISNGATQRCKRSRAPTCKKRDRLWAVDVGALSVRSRDPSIERLTELTQYEACIRSPLGNGGVNALESARIPIEAGWSGIFLCHAIHNNCAAAHLAINALSHRFVLASQWRGCNDEAGAVRERYRVIPAEEACLSLVCVSR